MNTEEARAAMDRAKADHARALLAALDSPNDSAVERQIEEAATAGLAAQIESIVPGEFLE